ncbi:MAG TPA: adenylate/guanylate cyclase domain-containing protein [Mucilaginibacter sp.]|jgi:class 3 adenylate cyclase
MTRTDIFINSFIPASAQSDETDYRNHKIFISVCFVSAIYALLFLPASVMEDYYQASYIIIFFFTCNFFLPFILRRGVSITTLANAYITVFAISLSSIMYVSGGVYHTSTDPQLMVLLPIMALLFINYRAAIIWFCISLALVAAFGILQLYGVKFDIKMNYKYLQLQNLFAVCGHIVLIFMVINIFDKQKTEAFKKIMGKNKIIEEERKKSDDLLLNILPSEVMEELKQTGKTTARNYDLVTVLFADFVNFTALTEEMPPEDLVSSIDTYFQLIDNIISKYPIEKIKTIGDAYICAAGLHTQKSDNPVVMVHAALELVAELHKLHETRESENLPVFDMRIGIHSGPLVAGVVGIKKFAYDIWGDTVNTAARMQQNGDAGKVNISGTTRELVKHRFHCAYRGRIEAKNKGLIDMYFVESRK